MKDLKERAVRGGFAKLCSQGVTFVLRVGSLMALGRLLEPNDFGLVGMVTAVLGVFNLFRDFGLSTATVQRADVTDHQVSTLFWINILVGTVLGLISLASAPIVASFYHEPRLVWVVVALSAGFLLNAAGVQHSVLLQRQMRFTVIASIEVVSQVASTAIGIGMALGGFGYWSLVVMTLTGPAISTIGAWLTASWVPGRPRRNVGIRSMMRFGGTITLNGLVVYVAYNLEKVLLGRFWGADVVGIYGRAYQLISIPTDNLNSAVGGVAFAALSRLQNEPARLKAYFLKAYSMVLALTLPVTIMCALFAEDIILVFLGPKWNQSTDIFRLLAPTIVIFALINPMAWLLFSTGRVGRSLKLALVIAPLTITGYILGLPYGPKGVAFAYSTAMTVWVVPHIAWCIHGTGISFKDVMASVSRPLVSGIIAAGFVFVVRFYFGPMASPLVRLILGGMVLLSIYLGLLMGVMGQKAVYLSLVKSLRRSAESKLEEQVAPA